MALKVRNAMQMTYVFLLVWSVVMVSELYHLMGHHRSNYAVYNTHILGGDEAGVDVVEGVDVEDQFPDPKACQPRKNIFYLKVHKTASTTFTAMLFHTAWSKNLSIVPVTRDPGAVKSFLPLVMRRPDETYPGEVAKYNIMAEHVWYNMRDVYYLLGPGVAHVASLRYPISHLKSMFNEYRLSNKMHIPDADPIPYFVMNHHKYKGALQNPQMLQFGISKKAVMQNNVSSIYKAIDYIDAQYDQVIITEYHSESMVLLRRRMCWEVRDVINVYLRERKYQYKHESYSELVRRRHREISLADYLLYEHFVERLFREIAALGKDFWDELYQYTKIQERVKAFCDEIVDEIKHDERVVRDYVKQKGGRYITINPAPYGSPFNMTALNCTVINLDTRTSRNVLRMREMRSICTNNNITRVHNKDWRMGFSWLGPSKVSIHNDFCTDWDETYQLPMKVMTKHYAYNIIL